MMTNLLRSRLLVVASFAVAAGCSDARHPSNGPGPRRLPDVAPLQQGPAAVLGYAPSSISVLRLDRPASPSYELMSLTSFHDREVRAWASQATQLDVISRRVVVLHGMRGPTPPSVWRRLGTPRPFAPGVVEHAPVDDFAVFHHANGDWVLAREPLVPPVRTWLAWPAHAGAADRVR